MYARNEENEVSHTKNLGSVEFERSRNFRKTPEKR